MLLREGARDALAALVSLKVPTTVVSAGLEHVIVGVLQSEGLEAVSFLDARASATGVRVFSMRARRCGGLIAWPTTRRFRSTVDGVQEMRQDARVRALDRLVIDGDGGALPDEPIHAKNKKDAYARLNRGSPRRPRRPPVYWFSAIASATRPSRRPCPPPARPASASSTRRTPGGSAPSSRRPSTASCRTTRRWPGSRPPCGECTPSR